MKAKVPLSEMFGYTTALRSMTEGRASFTMEFDHYEVVPPNVAKNRATIIAVFFFSGHGTQINGINYVTGKDTGVLTPASADLEAVRAEFALNVMAEAGVETAVMMLDACRNAPITKGTGKDIGEGFAAMRTPIGALISFATDPGDVADDGVPGENSPYTTSWLEEIEVPGEELGQIFRHVERKVMARTGNEQRPWTQSSGLKDVILTPKGPPSNNNSNGGKVQPGPGSIVIIPSPTLVQKISPEAEKLAQDAEDALENKQYQLAYSTIAQAITKDPNYSRVYNVAGYIAYKEYQTSPVIKYIIDGPQASLDDRKKMYDAIYPAFNDKVLGKYDKAAGLDTTAMSPLRNRGFAVLLVYQIQSAIGYRLGNLLDNALADFDAAITRAQNEAKKSLSRSSLSQDTNLSTWCRSLIFDPKIRKAGRESFSFSV
jgi:hypothetical protein